VINNAFRTYELSVDATGHAKLVVDGTEALTRTGYVLGGGLAIGDQTNDANVDGVMRIRSITKLCPP
jgi:hypothetical protein